jgi:hypothetical protein
MIKTWLKVGSAGVAVGVGVGVGMGVGVGVGVGVAAGVGVAVGRGVAVAVGTGLGLGVGRTGVGVGVACAVLLGFAVGVPIRPGADGVDEWDGASATDGGDTDPGAVCGPRINREIHQSNAATPAQRTSRRSVDMNGSPPTYH